jgi:acetyltransferase-like isoleucine patch superfamily enzyme
VVTKSMPANAVVGGMPARVIKYRTEQSNTTHQQGCVA